jgi:hypothetical protein
MTMRIRTFASVAAIGFGVLAIFQLALALGAPLGHAAWGGAHETLPTGLRVGSAVSVLFYVLAIGVVLRRAGMDVPWIRGGVARLVTWILVVLLPLSALGNIASQSGWERYLMAPLALILAAMSFLVARGAARQGETVEERDTVDAH